MDLNIAICEDEEAEMAYLTSLVRKWSAARGIGARLSGYGSAEDFLAECGGGKSVDILLLDIQMKEMDGVELARRVRGGDEAVQIVFVTGYPDFMSEGYDVSALHYLMKPVKEGKLSEVLDKALSRLRKGSRVIIFPKTGGDIKIKADDIIYAEVLSHTVALQLTRGKEEFQMRISDMADLLGDGFFKCHRSYIVSLKYVRRVTKAAMVLEGGREIPLSRSLYDAANQAFIKYN